MARQLLRSATLAATAMVVGAAVVAAQPRMNRGPNPDAPKLMVSACAAPDKVLSLLCADRIRMQVEGDVSFRSLLVFSKADVENTLSASGYDPAVALVPNDANALARQIKADFYIDGRAEKTGSGYKVEAYVVLSRDVNMRQPLGTFEHARIETIAQQVSKGFQDVFNKTFERSRDCFVRERERRYDEALKEAAAGLKDFPNSAWLRYCQLAVMKAQRAPAAEITKLVEEIRTIDPLSRAALQELVILYDAAGNREKKLSALEDLRKADPINPRLTADIVNELAAMGQFEKAMPIAQKAVAENPGDINLVRPYWLILISLKDYKQALTVGKQMATMDTSTADTAYFYKMISAANADSNFAEAADLSNRAATKFPAVSDYHTYAVALYRKAGNIPASVAAARRALAANPKAKDLRVQIASAFLAQNTVAGVDSAIAMAKEMQANGEDKEQIAGVAVQAGNILRTLNTPDSLKAKGASDAAIRAATIRTYEVTAWADTLATGTAVAAQGKFIFGVAALGVGQIYFNEAGDIGRKLQEDFRAANGNAARQKAIIDEANPRACAATTKAEEYFSTARGAVPAGGRFSPQAAQQVMGSLMQLDGFVEQMKKGYCK